MAESPPPPKDILRDILRVLERIEVQLETHDSRVKNLEDLVKSNDHSSVQSQWSDVVHSNLDQIPSRSIDQLPSAVTRRARLIASDTSGRNDDEQAGLEDDMHESDHSTKVKYSFWKSDNDDTFYEILDQDHSAVLAKYLGESYLIPDDCRLPLQLGWRDRSLHKELLPTSASAKIRRLQALQDFDNDLRAQSGNDFLVVDFDSSNNSRLFRIGETAIGNEIMVSPKTSKVAPWSRLILYQGMTTGNSIKPELSSKPEDPIPYFARSEYSTGVWNHIFSHLQLKRRAVTSNPYISKAVGFHTTFYDIRETNDVQLNEIWTHGPLYDHPLGWHFRKCAYTLYCPPQQNTGSERVSLDDFEDHWTLLVLAPCNFFDENNTSFPMKALSAGRMQELGHCLGKLSRIGAELNLISQGLRRISERWAEFQSFFDYVLDGGDSLMQPGEHDNLLFDDGSFSRSRRYFWAIDCLVEFDNSISDNIAQWEHFKAAISPLVENGCLRQLDYIQYRNAERESRTLQNQREFFRQKLAATRALRDALFNASAVIESRVSTRLGENVKLFTFVSVFFIPLSFCTSLWSINDKFSSTSFIIVIILVAVSTYVVIFNINTFAQRLGQLYNLKKSRVVRNMKADNNEAWKVRGQRFDIFKPKHDNPAPSEWYIALYAISHPLSFMGLGRRRPVKLTADFGIPNIFRRRRPFPKESEQPDEPWVI